MREVDCELFNAARQGNLSKVHECIEGEADISAEHPDTSSTHHKQAETMLSAVVLKARSELHQEDSFLGQLQNSLESRIKYSNADKANNLLSDEDTHVSAEETKTAHQPLLAAVPRTSTSRSESQLSGKTDFR